MADSCLLIFKVVIKYFNPFKTHTCFSSNCQTLVEIWRNIILHGWVQSELLYKATWSFCVQGFQYIHKTHTVYFLSEMFSLRIIQSLKYSPEKWFFPFHKCVHHINWFHWFIFIWTTLKLTERVVFKRPCFSLC